MAITHDILDAANRLRVAQGRPPAFARSTAGAARAVIVPGLGTASGAEIEARLARRDARRAAGLLAEAAARGAEVVTSCSGTFLVASAGLLDGRRATTAWWLAPVLQRRHPAVRLQADAILVRDGPFTTAGAALAQADAMLDFVGRHAGRRLAEDCARYLLLDGRRSQAAFVALAHLAAGDEAVARAERWARDNRPGSPSVAGLAAAAGMAPRSFARRVERVTGLSPVRFLQRVRVERALELLETTRLTLDEVARRVGYAEPSTLRRLLRAAGASPPRALRPQPTETGASAQ